ncbi:hypothetical protein SNOG_05201 [Parastagonospora nodorum SN15]|uniref:SPX domain-containing protein n=1 Tax=Phaeosphaeria nodorum (strain SN15 / ATCC MYA-4574 / FGSC 10173) TaxID=321614 RepID=Q0USR3_PHANO|nr:hypothetical protein SNOG_05201 [Parastagonospora nodorum SN15]EAT87592.2 hypothetical protein SNOG_05201 [Parastagonospora nodorum SN15]
MGTLYANRAPDNIDYDYLKDLIKHQTTPGTNKAVSIPGQGESSERAFGETFLQVLQAQHDRINLFVRSKSGEIERRLEHIEKSLEQLRQKQRAGPNGARLPARTVEKYAKIDADVNRTGEEIRSLSRFQVAQETGFTKILKKYKRWTGDREMAQAFTEQIKNRPDSLFKLRLGYLLEQYQDVLDALRAVFDGDGNTAAETKHDNTQSAAASIARALQRGDDLDFDTALTTVPLGSNGTRATYWIHPDHFVETQVLLLQHMRLYTGSTRSSSRNQSARPSPTRRKSSAANTDKYFGNGDEVGLLVLDHAEAFAFKQNASTISSTEATKGNAIFKAAGNVHCISSGDAAVVVRIDTNDQKQTESEVKTARTSLKTLPGLWSEQTQASGTQEDQASRSNNELAAVRQWLTEHKEVKPIAGVGSKRTRFVGLQNNSGAGLWATLDKEVYMKGSMSQDLANADWPSAARSNAIKFPHAILEVQLVKRRSRKAIKSSSTETMSQSSPPMTSTSNTSYDGQTSPLAYHTGDSSVTSELVDAPSLQAFRKKHRKPFAEYPPPISSAEHEPEPQRYWNEYDHPEDEDTGGYYIYVDPDAPVKFPGQELFEAISRKTKQWFGRKKQPDEESLLQSPGSDTSDDGTLDSSPITQSAGYGTMPTLNAKSSQEGYFSSLFRTLRDPQRDAQALQERRSLLTELEVRQHKTEMTKLRFYLTCLATAIVIDVILGLMTMTSRKKERGAVDVGVLFGTICTMVLVLVALISMKTRRERLGWVHQGAVGCVAAAIVALDVVLLSWVLRI